MLVHTLTYRHTHYTLNIYHIHHIQKHTGTFTYIYRHIYTPRHIERHLHTGTLSHTHTYTYTPNNYTNVKKFTKRKAFA